jgi:cytoskeletal protein RodZ
MTEIFSNNRSLELLVNELKAARVERKLSVDDVSQLTRIQKHHLEKLENGNFSFLPIGYVYACIKAYMREMELGDSEALEQCKEELKTLEHLKRKESIESDAKVKRKKQAGEINVSNSHHIKSILPLTIGMFIGVFGGITFSYMSDNAKVAVSNIPVSTAKPSADTTASILKKQHSDSSKFKQQEKNFLYHVTSSIPAKTSLVTIDSTASSVTPQ